MNERISIALKCFGKYLIGIVISFFIVFSFLNIFIFATTSNSGYAVYKIKDGNQEFAFQYENNDTSANERIEALKNDGYTVNQVAVRSELSKKNKTVSEVIALVATLFTETVIIHSVMWNEGNKKANKSNKFNGLFIGFLADIPSILLYIVLILCKFGILRPNFLSIYRILNSQFWGYINLVYGNAVLATDLNGLQLLLLALTLLFIPIVSTVSYFFGVADIKLSDKIIFKRAGEK